MPAVGQRFSFILFVIVLGVLPLWRGGNVETVWAGTAVLSSLCILCALPVAGIRLCRGIILPFALIAIANAIQLISLIYSYFDCWRFSPADAAQAFGQIVFFPCSVRTASTTHAFLQSAALLNLGTLGFWLARGISFTQLIPWLQLFGVFYGVIGVIKKFRVDFLQDYPAFITSDKFLDFEFGFVNPNTLATYLSVFLLASLCKNDRIFDLFKEKTGSGYLEIIVYYTAIMLIIVTLLLTQSRIGIISGFVGTSFFWISIFASKRSLRLLIFIFSLGMLIIFCSVILQYDAFNREIGDLSTSLSIRIALYESVIKLWPHAPLFGFGAGTFQSVFPVFNTEAATAYEIWDKAHSTFLALLFEQGLIGLCLFFAAFAIIFANTMLNWSKTRTASSLFASSAIVVVAFHSLSDFSMEIFGFAGTIALLLGAALRDVRLSASKT